MEFNGEGEGEACTADAAASLDLQASRTIVGRYGIPLFHTRQRADGYIRFTIGQGRCPRVHLGPVASIPSFLFRMSKKEASHA